MGLINYNYYNVILWKKNSQHRYYPNDILNFESDGEDYDYLLFLKFDHQRSYSIPNIDTLIASMELVYDDDETSLVVLTPRKKAPLYTAREDEFVYSFSCKFQYFKKLTVAFDKASILSGNLLFEMLDQMSKDDSASKRILIRQIPSEVNRTVPIANYSIIIPHRGDNQYLRNVLSFLKHSDKGKIYVGIDQEVTEDLLQLKKDYVHVYFYGFTPGPVGPYVVRNRLIEQSNDELIFFQDSDDISCADRFEHLSDYMKKSDCQLCGSHELSLDYYERTVRAIRFPIDVTAALNDGPWHSLLHPASAITRRAFYDCGKLSEERTFGNDTKFLLNSFFILKNIKNIDEFFYIRKRHPGTLTTSVDTGIGSETRKKLTYVWNNDFELVKHGFLKLENSNLKYESSKFIFQVRKM